MKKVRELAPLALGVAALGVVTWFLLDRDIVLGTWLLAAIIVGHGWIHLMFVFPQPRPAAATAGGPDWPFDMGRSWAIGGLGWDAGLLRAIGSVLVAVVFVTAMLAALATVGILVPTGWWAGLVVATAVGSMLLLALFWTPNLVIGFAVDLAFLWLALASAWSPVAG